VPLEKEIFSHEKSNADYQDHTIVLDVTVSDR
jgi:hypothetical protein